MKNCIYILLLLLTSCTEYTNIAQTKTGTNRSVSALVKGDTVSFQIRTPIYHDIDKGNFLRVYFIDGNYVELNCLEYSQAELTEKDNPHSGYISTSEYLIEDSEKLKNAVINFMEFETNQKEEVYDFYSNNFYSKRSSRFFREQLNP